MDVKIDDKRETHKDEFVEDSVIFKVSATVDIDKDYVLRESQGFNLDDLMQSGAESVIEENHKDIEMLGTEVLYRTLTKQNGNQRLIEKEVRLDFKQKKGNGDFRETIMKMCRDKVKINEKGDLNPHCSRDIDRKACSGDPKKCKYDKINGKKIDVFNIQFGSMIEEKPFIYIY